MGPIPWMVSLHGGHSGDYCDHAQGSLRAFVESAIERGFAAYGVSEHAPRYETRHLYPGEIAMGWDLAKLSADFERYAADSRAIAREYAGQLTVLRAFEAEVTPSASFVQRMQRLRQKHQFDYMVVSVHYIDDLLFDYDQDSFDTVAEHCGGPEAMAVRYYEHVKHATEQLLPDVVGHFDIVRRFAKERGPVDTPRAREAACAALQSIREAGAILDLNTGAYRKGDSVPYPAPWAVNMAKELGIPFCFGDDSHSPADVGGYLPEGRQYLLDNGITAIQIINRMDNRIIRQTVSLL